MPRSKRLLSRLFFPLTPTDAALMRSKQIQNIRHLVKIWLIWSLIVIGVQVWALAWLGDKHPSMTFITIFCVGSTGLVIYYGYQALTIEP